METNLGVKYKLGDCVRLEDQSSWCVTAIDSNKQEYRLGGIEEGGNHGQELIKPIAEIDEKAIFLGSFTHNGVDRSEPGVEKVAKEPQKLPPPTGSFFLGR